MKVVRRGDKGWTSDAEHEREVAARDPRLKFVNGDKAPLRPRIEHDFSEIYYELNQHGGWEAGDRVTIGDGPDHLTFEYKGDGQWRFCFRERGANR